MYVFLCPRITPLTRMRRCRVEFGGGIAELYIREIREIRGRNARKEPMLAALDQKKVNRSVIGGSYSVFNRWT